MMHRHGSLLRIDTCTQHGSRAEQYPDSAVVHVGKQFLTFLFGLGSLYKPYLICRNTHCHQLVFDVLIDVPLIRLVRA